MQILITTRGGRGPNPNANVRMGLWVRELHATEPRMRFSKPSKSVPGSRQVSNAPIWCSSEALVPPLSSRMQRICSAADALTSQTASPTWTTSRALNCAFANGAERIRAGAPPQQRRVRPAWA